MPENTPALMTADEVADLLRVTKQTVLRQQGKTLPAAVRIGSQWRFSRDAIVRAVFGEAA